MSGQEGGEAHAIRARDHGWNVTDATGSVPRKQKGFVLLVPADLEHVPFEARHNALDVEAAPAGSMGRGAAWLLATTTIA